MLNFRGYQPEDLEALRALIPAGAEEPDWTSVVVLEIRGKIEGFAAVQKVMRIEPLGASGAYAATLLWSYLDGRLANELDYEFFVLNSNAEMQKIVEKHCPVAEMKLGEGKWYRRIK